MRSIAIVVASAMLAGCSDPKSHAIIRRREAKVAETLQMAADAEKGRAERVQRTASEFTARVKQDADRLPEDFRSIDEQIRFEMRRWQERTPTYLQDIAAELRGKPEKAADTLPEMLY